MIDGADIHLGEDHRFREVYQNWDLEGAWKRNGRTITLTPETINGKTIAEVEELVKQKGTREQIKATQNFADPIRVTLSEDGKTLTAAEVAGGRTVYKKN